MISLPIDEMSNEEKIGVIETLWDDLCKQKSEISPPRWHREVLADRERWAQDQREEALETWKEAKRMINDE